MSTVRVGSTEQYAEGWDKVFGKKSPKKKTAKKAAPKASAKKKTAKKAAKKKAAPKKTARKRR